MRTMAQKRAEYALENYGIEAVEVVDHPWFLGVQFHPEFTSRLQNVNPSILAFVEASLKHKNIDA